MNIRDVLDRTDLASVLSELAGEPVTAGRLPRWRCCSADHADEHPSVTLEERAGLKPLTRPCGVPSAIRQGPQPFSAAALEYARQCAELLWTPQGSDARVWLHARGLTDQVLKDHFVGFDPGVRALPRADGLPRTRVGVTYVSFTGAGSPSYVQVRHLHPEAPSKYANPTPVHGSKPAATFTRTAAGGPLLVGEGVPDALIAACAGFRSAAIIDAASISPATIDQLAQAAGTAGVVLALDNDPAGQEATRRLRDGLAGRTHIQVLKLAPGFDLTDHYTSRPPLPLVAAR